MILSASDLRTGATTRGRSAFAILSALALALGALVGCDFGGPPEPAAEEPSRPVVVLAQNDISGVNELLASTKLDHEIRSQLFLHLLEEQPDYQEHPPTFAPALAESWELSDDRLRLTFRLRDGVTWSDGTPVTAKDVRWTWEAQTSPDVAWPYAFVKENISDVEVIDDHTVVFHFSEASPTQLLDANEGFILPSHAWSELPFEEWRGNADWFADHLVVDGPFTLARWEPNQEIVLERNDLFHEEGLPALERVVFRIVPDQGTRLRQLRSGEADVMEGIPAERADELDADPEIDLHTVWSRQYSYLVWNTARPLFSEPEVRRAMTMAIDREALVETLWHGRARIATSPIPSTVWAHHDEIEPWPYDPERTEEILAERGWSRGEDGILERDGVRFAFELTTNTGNDQRRDALVLIQEQLRLAGIEAVPRFVEGQSLISLNVGHLFDATLSAWAIDTSLDLRYAFHSDEIDGGYNFGSYRNPEVDRLIEEIADETSPIEAEPLFHRLQTILHEDQPYTFLWEPQWLVASRHRLEGVEPSPLLTFQNLKRWRLR